MQYGSSAPIAEVSSMFTNGNTLTRVIMVVILVLVLIGLFYIYDNLKGYWYKARDKISSLAGGGAVHEGMISGEQSIASRQNQRMDNGYLQSEGFASQNFAYPNLGVPSDHSSGLAYNQTLYTSDPVAPQLPATTIPEGMTNSGYYTHLASPRRSRH